ncbi:MAG: hypothetical protein OQK82_02065 [Candidatus Pacearchaeota archaeon]|nr:hypothetical protein [Candidatus Pacearchaeota archaeon]
MNRKFQNGVLVFSALTSIYMAIKGSPELIDLIKTLGSKVKK